MSISALIQAFRAIVLEAFTDRNNAAKWGGWIDVHGSADEPAQIQLNGKFTAVSVEMSGLKFEFTAGEEKIVLEARPNLHNLDVYLNGVLDPEARVVVAPKSTLAHPLRVGIDFRPVTFDGHESRFNLRYTG